MNAFRTPVIAWILAGAFSVLALAPAHAVCVCPEAADMACCAETEAQTAPPACCSESSATDGVVIGQAPCAKDISQAPTLAPEPASARVVITLEPAEAVVTDSVPSTPLAYAVRSDVCLPPPTPPPLFLTHAAFLL